MGQVLAAQQANSETDAADASIGNWFLHLPDEKKEIVGKDGKLDEMLFQAHMVIHALVLLVIEQNQQRQLTLAQHYSLPTSTKVASHL